MEIRPRTFLTIFSAAALFFSGYLLGQEQIQPDGVRPGEPSALIDFSDLADVSGFLKKRRAYIKKEVAEIHRNFLSHKVLPAGIETEGEQSFVLISGRDRPDLFDHGTVLGILFRHLNSSLREKRVAGLMARGLRPDDIRLLLTFIDSPDYPNTAQKLAIDKMNDSLPRPAKTAPDEAIRSYLEDSHQMVLEGVDVWAAQILNELPLRVKRIIFSYAYEVVVPNSHMTQATAFTHRDIEYFRSETGEH